MNKMLLENFVEFTEKKEEYVSLESEYMGLLMLRFIAEELDGNLRKKYLSIIDGDIKDVKEEAKRLMSQIEIEFKKKM